MHIVALAIVFGFVFSVLAVAAFAMFKMSPFAHHADRYRDPETGKKRFESPRLD